jgi:nicotinate-nucleotide pyrophosphorylase (carboxylating)
LLSGTATKAHQYSKYVGNHSTQILDTRKTLPGLRIAQKYAVHCGGCTNHRLGLFDAYLIKENHIISCGGIGNAVNSARKKHPNLEIEIEVESIAELLEAIDAKADIAMIDNFSSDMTNQAVEIAKGKIKLEASGGIDQASIAEIAETGVDYISIGALTKEVNPIDLSMRFET